MALKPWAKVAIGVPSGDMIHSDFAMSLTSLVLASYARGIHIDIINQKSSILEIGRCEIVAHAFNIGADYLFFLDSDMLFPHLMLARLLSHKKDVVCCDAVRRRPPYTQVVRKKDKTFINHNEERSLIEVAGATTACMLVKMSVFNKIGEPYFLVEWRPESKSFLGEDYYFTKRCNEHGIKVYCDTFASRSLGHIGTKDNYIQLGK